MVREYDRCKLRTCWRVTTSKRHTVQSRDFSTVRGYGGCCKSRICWQVTTMKSHSVPFTTLMKRFSSANGTVSPLVEAWVWRICKSMVCWQVFGQRFGKAEVRWQVHHNCYSVPVTRFFGSSIGFVGKQGTGRQRHSPSAPLPPDISLLLRFGAFSGKNCSAKTCEAPLRRI